MGVDFKYEFYKSLYEAELSERNLFYTRIQMMITIEALLAASIAYCVMGLPEMRVVSKLCETHFFLTLTSCILGVACFCFARAVYFTIRGMHKNRHGMLREPEHYDQKYKFFDVGNDVQRREELLRKHILRHLIGAGTESSVTNDKRRRFILHGNDYLIATFVLICVLAYPLRRVQIEFPVVSKVQMSSVPTVSVKEVE